MAARTFLRGLIQGFLLFSAAQVASAATIFQDGFESGTLGPAWTISSTADGRATVTTNFAPAAGQWHLVLDDSVTDDGYSVAECTLQLDLSEKRNIQLKFKAKSLGNESHYAPTGSSSTGRTFDSVQISTNGGATWSAIESLAFLGMDWADYSIRFFGSYGTDTRIRFTEYDNASAPLDGIAIDDIQVTAEEDLRALVEVPASIVEGGGAQVGYVFLSHAPTNAVTFSLDFSLTGVIAAPSSVTVPAGKRFVTFDFSVPEDNLVTLSRYVYITAEADGYHSAEALVKVLDNEGLSVVASLPVQLVEGGAVSNNNATLTLNRAPDVDCYFYLRSSPDGINAPHVYFSPGQTQAVFTVSAPDDYYVQGTLDVTVVTELSGRPMATNHVTVLDKESRTLSLELPDAIQEGASVTGKVKTSGYVATNLLVNLLSSNPGSLAVPVSVRINSGQKEASFTVHAVDNALRDGTRMTTVTARADSFTNAIGAVTIRDNEVAGYHFNPLGDLVNIGHPVEITVSAADVTGNPIEGVAGAVRLSVRLPDGTALPLSPETVSFGSATGWTGNVTLPPVSTTPLRLQAMDDEGRSGESKSFDIMRTLELPIADLAWDPHRNLLYASVTNKTGSNIQSVVAINPETTQILGSVFVGQSPSALAMTSGGEYLYVARKENGTITQIELTNRTLVRTFPLGTHTNYGTLYASDISAVRGRPELLVVSRKLGDTGNYDVAAYENGFPRPNSAHGSYYYRTFIEPSADPSVFFAFTSSGENFRQLQLDIMGLSTVQGKSNLFSNRDEDIRSDGDLVVSMAGSFVDGKRLAPIGVFPATGPVFPELAANRVYFIEPEWQYSYRFNMIGAYDSATLQPVCRVEFPTPVTSVGSLIRWGSNGIAFRADTNLILISSQRLVQNPSPANLQLRLSALPNPATTGLPLTYTLSISNLGPETASGTVATANLSDGQTLTSVSASQGTWTSTNSVLHFEAGDLPSNGVAVLTITTLPTSAGTLRCSAVTTSQALDPDFGNNLATNCVTAGFQSAIAQSSRLRFGVTSVLYDAANQRLWAVGHDPNRFLSNVLVAIDPTTVLTSQPYQLAEVSRCLGLSEDGRYLYVSQYPGSGLTRFDTTTMPPLAVPIPLGTNQFGEQSLPLELEPLNGVGTSFLVVMNDKSAAVFDGAVMRPIRSGRYLVEEIERTDNPDVFVGRYGSSLSRLLITASGVVITQTVNNIVSSVATISGGKRLLLSEEGKLFDTRLLELHANLDAIGRPCLDEQNQRAYLLTWSGLQSFDTTTALPTGQLEVTSLFQSTSSYGWKYIRWGLNGFAFYGNDRDLYLVRWPGALPATMDSNSNEISDAWEATYFNSLNVDPAGDDDGDGLRNFQEYLHGTSPVQASANPVQVSASNAGGQSALRLVFPRREGLPAQSYGFVASSNLTEWVAAQDVTEKALSAQTIDGITFETVEALIPITDPNAFFVRFRWRN